MTKTSSKTSSNSNGSTSSSERSELHKTIWRIANDLRGSIDGWDFKSYVLGMLFYRFISENLSGYLNEQERKAGTPDFDYAELTDEQAEFGRADTPTGGRAKKYAYWINRYVIAEHLHERGFLAA